MSQRQRGYSWPSSEVTYVDRPDDGPEITHLREVALAKLLERGDIDIAVMFGLLPEEWGTA